MQPQLVKQPGPEDLPREVRAAPQQDILVTCGGLRPGQGALDAVVAKV